MSEERRTSTRTSLAGRPPVVAAVGMEGMMVPVAVVPHDLSATGVRGRWDTALPEERDFPLTLHLGRPLHVTARVVWQHVLPRGAALAGLTFLDSNDLSRKILADYLASLQQDSRRGDERVTDIVPVEVVLQDGESSFTAVATNVSRSGLQLANDFALPPEETLTLLLPLAWAPPLRLEATVRWQKSDALGGWEAGLQFVAPSQEDVSALDAFLKEESQG
jgi:hypothetical protein